MATWRPDRSFYATPRHAMEAPPEQLAYVALLTPGETGGRDALGVVDTDPQSSSYGTLVGSVDRGFADRVDPGARAWPPTVPARLMRRN